MTELAVITQPGANTKCGVPLGLEYLDTLDKLVVKIRVKSGLKAPSTYDVFNNLGQDVFRVVEDTEMCHRICCGNHRGYIFHVHDGMQQEVLAIDRQFRCCVGCNSCIGEDGGGGCDYPISVSDGKGRRIGTIRSLHYMCSPRFGIFDTSDQLLYQIRGDYYQIKCNVCIRDDVQFPVINMYNGVQAANITKVYNGMGLEMVRLALTYECAFPIHMEATHKALIFASVFMIDVHLYKQSKKGKEGRSDWTSQAVTNPTGLE